MKIPPWGKPIVIAAAMLLAGCSAATNEAIDAVEGVVEQKVDATIARGVNRACKGPIDVVMRAAEVFPALLPFVFASCPETYKRLRDAVLADLAQKDAIADAVRRALQ